MNLSPMDWSIISDQHKDAYGYRPGEGVLNSIREMDADQFDTFCKRLDRAVEDSINEERQQQKHDIAMFEADITEIMTTHGVDRATAIRWDREAFDCLTEDMNYYCYLRGLPSGYFS